MHLFYILNLMLYIVYLELFTQHSADLREISLAPLPGPTIPKNSEKSALRSIYLSN